MKLLWSALLISSLLMGCSNQSSTTNTKNNYTSTTTKPKNIQNDSSSSNENKRTFQFTLGEIYKWKLTSSGQGMFKADNILYKSEDGGEDWKELSVSKEGTLPNSTITGIKFSSEETGWITVATPEEGNVGLFRTNDGGKNWSQVNLEIPAKYISNVFNSNLPIFFGSTDYGFLSLVSSENQVNSDLIFFITDDKGQNWKTVVDKEKGTWNKLTWEALKNNKNYSWEINIDDEIWTSSDGEIWSVKK